MAHDLEGNIRIWDKLNLRYPIFHESNKRIGTVWAEFSENFIEFYDNFLYDAKIYTHNRTMVAKGEFPLHFFNTSFYPMGKISKF